MEMLQTLGINWQMIIAQMINFGVLLGVLSYLLYKPLLRVIDERRERVQKSLENAAKIEKQVAELEKTRKKQLKDIDDQARTILAEARAQGEKTKEKMLSDARTEVERIIEKGRKQLDDEQKRLMSDLQNTVTTVGITLAQKVLQREFSDADQKRLLKDFEKDVPALIG